MWCRWNSKFQGVIYPLPVGKRSVHRTGHQQLINSSLIGVFLIILKFNVAAIPRGLKSRSAAARLLGFRVGIPLGVWMSISYECCVSSGAGLCDGPISRREDSYRLWCVWVWSRFSTVRRPRPARAVEPWNKNAFCIWVFVYGKWVLNYS
jgi:hypothetical protein